MFTGYASPLLMFLYFAASPQRFTALLCVFVVVVVCVVVVACVCVCVGMRHGFFATNCSRRTGKSPPHPGKVSSPRVCLELGKCASQKKLA